MLSASNEGIKAERARILGNQASISAGRLVTDLQDQVLVLENKVYEMTDFAPESADSLRPGAGFNAATWIKDLHKTRLDLRLKRIELDEAEQIYNEWFGETETAKPAKAKKQTVAPADNA
jgi:hypothetical protein